MNNRTKFNRSRFAQSGSQIERKPSTRNHAIVTLTAATSNLIATISSSARGRTATNSGIDRSPDQKSDLENALPTAEARITGMARVHARIHKVPPGSLRMYQEIGAITTASSPAI